MAGATRLFETIAILLACSVTMATCPATADEARAGRIALGGDNPFKIPGQPTDSDFLSRDKQLTPTALQLAKMLNILDEIELLKEKVAKGEPNNRDDQIDVLLLRQKLMRAIQYASLELEEAIANIDGDLAVTNMQYSFFSAKRDRTVLMNNVATFVGSGTFGILDSGSGIKYGPPTPNILGIVGNAIAVGLPLLAVIPPRYKNPDRGEHQGNMLAPIFGRTYAGAGYDPVVWQYIQSVPAGSTVNATRREMLLKTWKSYRGLRQGPNEQSYIDSLTGISKHDARVSLDLLKTRAELLVELRALVQHMYKDISDLNTVITAL